MFSIYLVLFQSFTEFISVKMCPMSQVLLIKHNYTLCKIVMLIINIEGIILFYQIVLHVALLILNKKNTTDQFCCWSEQFGVLIHFCIYRIMLNVLYGLLLFVFTAISNFCSEYFTMLVHFMFVAILHCIILIYIHITNIFCMVNQYFFCYWHCLYENNVTLNVCVHGNGAGM